MNYFKQSKPTFLNDRVISASLVSGSFKKISVLPKYVDEYEWIASNCQDFVTFITYFYASIASQCTESSCPLMNAGNQEYLWIDSQKKSLKISAPQYIDYAFSWIQSCLQDEMLFPTRQGSPFPKDFAPLTKAIFKQLMRILSHIYHSHFDTVLELGQESHLNTLFGHFVCFSREFDLLEKREYSAMADLVQYLIDAERI